MPEVHQYTRPSGECPYDDYVEGVRASGKTAGAAKIDATASLLGRVGSQGLARVQRARKLNDLWELRPGPHRIFYFWDSHSMRYILLNGYPKGRQKLPENIRQRAEHLKAEYLSRSR